MFMPCGSISIKECILTFIEFHGATVNTFLLVFKSLKTVNRQLCTCNPYNGLGSSRLCNKKKKIQRKNPEVIYSEKIMQDCICGTDCFHQSFLMEGYLESSIIYSPLLWLSAAPLTHSSTEADSTSAWLSRGTPRFRHYVRSPLCARVRVCLSARLPKQNANTAERCSERYRQKGKKRSPESRRTGVARVCLLQREGGERNGLRNSEVVQESWAEPQCCVDCVYFSRARQTQKLHQVQHNQRMRLESHIDVLSNRHA